MITNAVAVFFVLAAVVAIAVGLESRYHLFRSLGSALVAILLGMLLSNAGLIPGTSPAYDFLVGPGVSAGIILILLSVEVKSVIQAGPTMLAAFAIGAVGTAAGASIGALVLNGQIGPETWKLAGQYTGTYTGGGVNFAAVGTALETSPDLFSAGIAADVIVTAIWMATCLIVPVLWSRGGPGQPAASSVPEAAQRRAADDVEALPRPETLEKALYSSIQPIGLMDVSSLAVITLGTLWAADVLGALLAPIPSVLWLTTIALILAQIPAVKRLSGAAVIGNYLVILFLASNGASSVVANIVEVGPPIFYFALITVSVHGLVIFGVGRLFGLDIRTLAVASQANVGGPASAMALASARGYMDRLLPGVAVGLLGYAAGNYAGLLVASVLRGVLGG
jgi:uncharacterized membrane protein